VIEQHVGSHTLNPADLRCPQCQGNTLTLHGNVQIPRMIEMAKGEILKSWNGPEEEKFELEQFDCCHCNVRWVVKPREYIQLETELFKLRELYQNATGIDPFGHGLPC
jgi:DNA-directed RNA polymerase subunit RPC12/RpoP